MGANELWHNTKRFFRELDYRRVYLSDAGFRAAAASDESCEFVTYFCYAGLANRLRSHFAASLLARNLGRKLLPLWIPTLHLNARAGEVFDEIPAIPTATLIPKYHLLKASSFFDRRDDEPFHVPTGRLLVLDFDFQWRALPDASAKLGGASAIFSFNTEIVSAANDLISQFQRPYLAVHVRQTDFITTTNNAKPLAYFEDQIVQECTRVGALRYKTLVISSDDNLAIAPRVAEGFEHVVQLRPSLGRTEEGVASEALTHLLCLGRADAFIGTPKSSFSEFAAAMQHGLVVVSRE